MGNFSGEHSRSYRDQCRHPVPVASVGNFGRGGNGGRKGRFLGIWGLVHDRRWILVANRGRSIHGNNVPFSNVRMGEELCKFDPGGPRRRLAEQGLSCRAAHTTESFVAQTTIRRALIDSEAISARRAPCSRILQRRGGDERDNLRQKSSHPQPHSTLAACHRTVRLQSHGLGVACNSFEPSPIASSLRQKE